MVDRLTAARFPFLARLSSEGRRELVAIGASSPPPRKRLLGRGDAAGGAYLVLGGALRVFYITPEGRESTLYHVRPGHTCVLALSATLEAQPYPAWVEAGPRGAIFVCVPSDAFHRLVQREPAFRGFVLSALADRVLELMLTLEELGSARVEQRLARLLSSASGSVVHATQAQIASDLGTAREVVSRALRSLARRSLIRTGRERTEILDRAGLERVARSSLPRMK